MITRTFHATTKMVVGFRDPDKKDYTPAPTKISKPITQNKFKTSIVKYKRLMYDSLYPKYHDLAEDEAEKFGTDAYLKSFNMYNEYVEEFGEPEQTIYVQDIIDYYQPRIIDADEIEYKEELREEAITEMINRGLTREEAQQLMR